MRRWQAVAVCIAFLALGSAGGGDAIAESGSGKTGSDDSSGSSKGGTEARDDDRSGSGSGSSGSGSSSNSGSGSGSGQSGGDRAGYDRSYDDHRTTTITAVTVPIEMTRVVTASQTPVAGLGARCAMGAAIHTIASRFCFVRAPLIACAVFSACLLASSGGVLIAVIMSSSAEARQIGDDRDVIYRRYRGDDEVSENDRNRGRGRGGDHNDDRGSGSGGDKGSGGAGSKGSGVP